jgi:magnesium-transporting ATPase (P-type)
VDQQLAAASGAAFITVVFAQAANAFACRSSTHWPGSLGWGSNRLLLGAVAVGIVFSLLTLWIPLIAELLGQASPPAAGWLVAFAAIPTLLGIDALEKRMHRRWMPRAGAR